MSEGEKKALFRDKGLVKVGQGEAYNDSALLDV